MYQQYLEIGQIVGTHGIMGELKLEAWADSPEWLKKIKTLYFDKGRTNANLKSSRVHKNLLLITIEGITNPTDADMLRGKILYMDRKDAKLPKNRFFIADLIGIEVYDAKTGAFYGTVEEVFNTPANNVYKIVKDGKDYLFPAVDHMIKSTDIENNRLEVLPIEGIFAGEVISDEN